MSSDQISPPENLALAELISVDSLGYECIRETDIDLAFQAGGKGLRLPRTCLPEPCNAALSQVELASLIGRKPFPSEWDDYFSRYADHCRKEVVPFDEGAADPIETAADFWRPLVRSYPPSAPIRAGLPQGPGPAPGFTPTGPGTTFTPVPPITGNPPPPPTDGQDPDIDPPAPVPLPGALMLWLTAIGGLAIRPLWISFARPKLRRRQTEARSGWRPRQDSNLQPAP